MKEFDFIELLKSTTEIKDGFGIGDDAALAGGLLIAKDLMSENIHFKSEAPVDDIIFKLFTANVSDIAAMGARAQYGLLGISIPEGRDPEKLADAVKKAAEFYNIALIGGDTTGSAQHLHLSLTVIGQKNKNVLRRSGAKAGDIVFLSRPVGDAAKLLAKELKGEAEYGHYRLTAECAVGEFLGQTSYCTACIDVSDGVASDAGHISKASSVKIIIEDELLGSLSPEADLNSGEEFALLFTVKPETAEEFMNKCLQQTGTMPLEIGRVEPGEGVFFEKDKELTPIKGGFEHNF